MTGRAPVPAATARRRIATGAMLLLASILIGPPASARAGVLAFPDRIGPVDWPPFRLVRARPAVPLPEHVLGLRFEYEGFAYPERAGEAEDAAWTLLADGGVRRLGIDAGFGIGYGLTARTQVSWLGLDLAPAGNRTGIEDLAVGLDYAHPLLGGRLRGRLGGGAFLATGRSDALAAGDAIIQPFTAGGTAPFAGAGLTVALTGAGVPVPIHFHAEGRWTGRVDLEPGEAFVPFRERMPALSIQSPAADRLDWRFAIALTHGRTTLFAEYELPRLQGVREMAPKEAPRSLSPGFALRAFGLELSTQADLLLASDDPATAFDPRLVYPEWTLRVRVGPDLAVLQPDHDGDGVGDLEDLCPREVEDRDGFADRDGCPDLDNDGDGILDFSDECPNDPEDRDGFQDDDGCPDLDDDGDGIPDRDDLCPKTPEDLDGFEDDDGCPEPGTKATAPEPAAPSSAAPDVEPAAPPGNPEPGPGPDGTEADGGKTP